MIIRPSLVFMLIVSQIWKYQEQSQNKKRQTKKSILNSLLLSWSTPNETNEFLT